MYHARPDVAQERFNHLVKFLEEHGETEVARQAQVEKDIGGMWQALYYIGDNAGEGFSTPAGREAAPLIVATIIGIMQTLPHP